MSNSQAATIWAIVPVKKFALSKSRLSSVLAPDERAQVSREFLVHTLEVLAQVPQIQATLVVSRDPAALVLARERGARALKESGTSNLNFALTLAAETAISGGAEAVLVLPTDLPLLSPDDVRELTKLQGHGLQIAIAPDRHEKGTNALFFAPPGGLAFAFGADSFAQHKFLAQAFGARLRICRLPGVALDVDGPEDWQMFQAARVSGGLQAPPGKEPGHG